MAVVESGSIFELWVYTGPSGLTVNGFSTGLMYRFPYSGARIAVDQRDAAWWASMPFLRRCL